MRLFWDSPDWTYRQHVWVIIVCSSHWHPLPNGQQLWVLVKFLSAHQTVTPECAFRKIGSAVLEVEMRNTWREAVNGHRKKSGIFQARKCCSKNLLEYFKFPVGKIHWKMLLNYHGNLLSFSEELRRYKIFQPTIRGFPTPENSGFFSCERKTVLGVDGERDGNRARSTIVPVTTVDTLFS
jgi:hypothetical protein